MSFSIQKMLLTTKSENEKEYGELSLTVDSDKYRTFTIGYQGTLQVNYGDGITETLNSTSLTSKSHTYPECTITFEYSKSETDWQPPYPVYAVSVYSESGELLGHLYDPNEILIINNPLVVGCNIGDKFIVADPLGLITTIGCDTEFIHDNPIKGQEMDLIVTAGDRDAKVSIEGD